MSNESASGEHLFISMLGEQIFNDSAMFNASDINYYDLTSFLADIHSSLLTVNEPRTIALIIVYIPVFLLALGGNLLVILVILTTRHMRSVTNYFLLNLSIADLLVTVFCIPLTVGEIVYKVWIYGDIMCKAVGYLQGVSITASVLTIMALSFERFLVIRHPVVSRRITTNKRYVMLCIALIWCISCGVMVPFLIVRGITQHPLSNQIHICHEKWSTIQHRQALDIFLFVFIYVIPGVVVIGLHSASGCHLMIGSQELHRQGSVPHSQKLVAGRRRAARMLISLAVLFAISWMPYNIITLYTNFHPREAEVQMLTVSLSILLGHSNSAQNPVLYCLMNGSFRRGIRELMRCSGKGKNQSTSFSSSHRRLGTCRSHNLPVPECEPFAVAQVNTAPNDHSSRTSIT